MQFNSAEYLLFLPVTVLIYFALPHRWRCFLLLGASYYFYMAWKVEYVLLLLASTVLDYSLALRLEATQSNRLRNLLLAVSLSSNLGLLFAFKYANFFSTATHDLLTLFNIFYQFPSLQLLLPVGISFYTFQTMSYTIDVYRGIQPAERSFVRFALYVSFFPQLVAGPIERSTRLLPQFMMRHEFDHLRIASGLRRIAWGLFKKIVIADKAAVIVDTIYQQPADHAGYTLLFATYLFAFQIYCDFSGYTDIAIGTARLFGIELMENFRQPYLSKSVGEFWRRWHISLSTWFRDYLYIPLGGNRVGELRLYLNLFIVFVVSGLWHGASWTYVIWGALHGCYMVIEQYTQTARARWIHRLQLDQLPRLHQAMQIVIVFHLTVLAWIFFRAESVADALLILHRIVVELRPEQFTTLQQFFDLWLEQLHTGKLTLGVLALSVVLLEAVESLRSSGWLQLAMRSPWIRWASYYALILLILLFGELRAEAHFIYFQF